MQCNQMVLEQTPWRSGHLGCLRTVQDRRTRHACRPLPCHLAFLLTLPQDSGLAHDAFSRFIPMSVESDARTRIIFDFFDLLAAIAAHSKSNGLGGRKLSRYAGWWAFEQKGKSKGFEEAYNHWALWVPSPSLSLPHPLCVLCCTPIRGS